MIELDLLGVNGDTIVMTNADGERFTLVIDDALRAAVRRDRPNVEAVASSSQIKPRDLQSLMRAGATAEEVASSTGMSVDKIRAYEGPVLAERAWAVTQAKSCRIGWDADAPVLEELVIDRLATRGVDPQSLQWDAVRQGREPWEVMLTFVQGAEEKEARWMIDVSSHALSALDDESRWLTESASAAARRPSVFDQDSPAQGAVAMPVPLRHNQPSAMSALSSCAAPSALSAPAPTRPTTTPPLPNAPSAATATSSDKGIPSVDSFNQLESTEAILADLNAARGQRVELEPSDDELLTELIAQEESFSSDAVPVSPVSASSTSNSASATDAMSALSASSSGPLLDAQVLDMSAHRRGMRGKSVSSLSHGRMDAVDATVERHPAGSQRGSNDDSATSAPSTDNEQNTESQMVFPQMPQPEQNTKPKSKKRGSRRSVPSWDEIVFGSKPE
ncbi:septation protein SepH [Actinomyces vulturis]|uniref:septation protein SepH n=1 Tax=Actinomyces vulturis TaxID=1857645 RepID=UPI0008364479|nr:septation protein SepH [Actinomyces vulturis]